jgi:hypothetical protein
MDDTPSLCPAEPLSRRASVPPLQALRISGAYPFASLSGMLFMLFLNIRECDERMMHSKLSLLLYYLLDLGHMQPEPPG